jgi:acetylornithine deacetylase/succinyl-diaminopimelate desuccinylase-like protein
MRMMFCASVCAMLLSGAAAAASDTERVREFRATHERELLAEYTTLLAMPNVVGDRAAIRRNADALVAMMQRRGLSPQLLEGDDPDVPPLVYGEWNVGANITLVFYAHYDGQPVNPDDWASDPWQPVWRDGVLSAGAKIVTLPASGAIDPSWRLYGRSASDDKAGVMSILTAAQALRAAGLEPTVNLKFVFEGEEEAGSPHLGALLKKHRARFGNAAWIICDGPVHRSGRKQVVFGVRGDLNVELTVYGPKRPLHSGHYGNWAPNPARLLSQLLATMYAPDGKVAIAGWYDDVVPLGAAEQAAMRAAPQDDDGLRRELGLAASDRSGLALIDAIAQPSLNINGMRSANVGAQASNVIPTTATAVLDLRLVKGNTPDRQVERLIAHIRAQGYTVLNHEPTDAERLAHARIVLLRRESGGYAASRTAMDSPLARAVVDAVQASSTQDIVALPTLGGSLPLAVITDTLGADTITVPIANHDNNQHAENENLRLQNLWDGIETMAAVMRLPIDAYETP